MRWLANVFRLGVKEISSLLRDRVLMALIIYTFTFAIYSVANGVKTEVRNASVAVVDEDRSALSSRIVGAFLPPYFAAPVMLDWPAVDQTMDAGHYTFVLNIPSGFEGDVLAGRRPVLQLNVDATAITVAGNGTNYISNIVNDELWRYVEGAEGAPVPLVDVQLRAKFNPNLDAARFLAIMQVINNLTVLAIVLSGAAVIREREHGTVEHLLVMPVSSGQIISAKIWSNGLIILIAALLSLQVVVRGFLGVPITGSMILFGAGAAIYLFSVTALGVGLSTIATSMPQFGLLSIPIFVVMNLLSGGLTPIESMPVALQHVVQILPSTHFVQFAQAVLSRGATFDIVWPHLAFTGLIGAVCFAVALLRFRGTLAAVR